MAVNHEEERERESIFEYHAMHLELITALKEQITICKLDAKKEYDLVQPWIESI